MTSIPYNDWLYLYPPRPQTKVRFGSDTFRQFQERPEYIAQFKLNGQRNEIVFFPDGHIEMWSRHHEKHRSYNAPGWLIDALKSAFNIEEGKFTILDSELLHNKDRHVKNVVYIFDVLVLNGMYLVGESYESRHSTLVEIANINSEDDLCYRATDNVWIAKNLSPTIWDSMWEHTETSWVEGFVLKNAKAELQFGFKKDNNGGWMIRCRKPHKNFSEGF